MTKPKTINDIFLEVSSKHSDRVALTYLKGHHFERVTYGELKELVFKFSSVLENKGVQRSDKVLLISKNRPEWIISDLAIQLLGAINVPIHQVLSGKQMKGIIDEIQPKVIIACTSETVSKLGKVDVFDKYKDIITFDQVSFKDYNLNYFKELVEKAEPKERKSIVGEDDLASIIYTSGTTGKFSGVKLTHKNFVSNIIDLKKIVDIKKTDRFISVLPLSHVFERTTGYYVPLASGSAVSYIDDPTKLAEVAIEVKPTIIVAVPRLYEKIYDKIIAGTRESNIKEKLFGWALKVGKRYNIDKDKSATLPYLIAEKIVFSKVKKKFGNSIRFLVSGAAPLADDVSEFFLSMGWLVLEGYGLTETSPVLTCNTLEKYKFGSAGLPLPSVDIKISGGGEILVKGPNVTSGYLNPQKTKESFTKDGYFKTGDIGYFDQDGFLRIEGRKKEFIALSTGKKVSPIIVEEELEAIPCVGQAFVFGEGKKHISALIYPELDIIKVEFGDIPEKDYFNNEKVFEFIKGRVTEQMENLAPYERATTFRIIKDPFTIENGLLTPTLKLRRHLVLEKYKKELESLY